MQQLPVPVLVTCRSALEMRDACERMSYKFVAMAFLGGIMAGSFLVIAFVPSLASMRDGLNPAYVIALVAALLALVVGLTPFKEVHNYPVMADSELEAMRAIGVPPDVVKATEHNVLMVKRLD